MRTKILTIRYLILGENEVIISRTALLAFNITLNGDTDANRTIVNNHGWALVNKISVKLERQEVTSLDDDDIYLCYRDLWMTDKEKVNAAYYGIHVNDAETRQKFGWVLATPWLQLSQTRRSRQLSVTGLSFRSTLRFSRIMARSTRLG